MDIDKPENAGTSRHREIAGAEEKAAEEKG